MKDEHVGHKGQHATGQNAHGQMCPIRQFYYALNAHTAFLRCFVVVATFSASMLWHCPSSNINDTFDVTKGQAGVDCAQIFLAEHSNISLRRPIATNLARIRGFNFNLYKNY